MPRVNIWEADGFSLESLTAAVNSRSYRPGQVSALGIFGEDSVSTTVVSIEYKEGKLSLIEPTPRGGPGEVVNDDDDRDLIPFIVDHYQRDSGVKADEVQNVRAFGTDSQLETVLERVNSKAAKHAQDLTMTLEHQRVGSLKGIVTSKSGKVLHNLYTRFGIAEPAAVSLELDVDTTKVAALWQDVRYSIEDALDEPYDGFHVLTGRDFHKALWTHKSVMDTFLYHAGAAQLRLDVPDTFEFGGATWERYRTGAKATTDLGAPYIAATEARVIVKGVPDLFITRFAPADYEETVNTPGLPFYAKQFPTPDDKGRNLQVQMNAISLCTRPQVLRKLTLT
ncbi:hypothetical protein FHS55_002131 [Angulomicrobium tetraedrale]|uniref:Major capsid protein n=1 Tax=Ancylobacter tetraedralis TaxID=217068 RepID=A0A839Z9X7_9HYPH|nr:major capsid protein [Ancylobacter tetraedralis]MBB3771532.1 hypothetical protein [Ancylobacter tetraedralis]